MPTLMTLDQYTEATGLTQEAILRYAQVGKSTLHSWRHGLQSPSLLNVITLFLISDGNIGLFDMLCPRDKDYLTQFFDRIPNDRLEDLEISLQKVCNSYCRDMIDNYLEEHELL